MIRLSNIYFFILVIGLVGGCASTPQLEPSAEFAPVLPPKVEDERPATGSIFQHGESWTWFGRKREQLRED